MLLHGPDNRFWLTRNRPFFPGSSVLPLPQTSAAMAFPNRDNDRESWKNTRIKKRLSKGFSSGTASLCWEELGSHLSPDCRDKIHDTIWILLAWFLFLPGHESSPFVRSTFFPLIPIPFISLNAVMVWLPEDRAIPDSDACIGEDQIQCLTNYLCDEFKIH